MKSSYIKFNYYFLINNIGPLGSSIPFKGNIGEWSEIIVLLQIMIQQVIYLGDIYYRDKRISKEYRRVIEIIRIEKNDHIILYKLYKDYVAVYLNGVFVRNIDIVLIVKYLNMLLDVLINPVNETKDSKFRDIELFLSDLCCKKLRVKRKGKCDIYLKILFDTQGTSSTDGYDIKSRIGANPKLLGASNDTLYIYQVCGLSKKDHEEINAMKTKRGFNNIKGRIQEIYRRRGWIVPYRSNQNLTNSSIMNVETDLVSIIENALIYYNLNRINKITDLVDQLYQHNPLNYKDPEEYKLIITELLFSLAVGLKNNNEWQDDLIAGYIFVNKKGNILLSPTNDPKLFRQSLFENTKFDTPSSRTLDFGRIYYESDLSLIKLAYQIRFI